MDFFGDLEFFGGLSLAAFSVYILHFTHTHIWLREEVSRKLKLVEHGRVIFSLTHIEVSSQPFANIPRCIALGVMEGLFILAKKERSLRGDRRQFACT